MPELNYLPEAERSQVHVNGWTTTIAKYENKIEHTQRIRVSAHGHRFTGMLDTREKQVHFWHANEHSYDCDVCASVFGEVVKKAGLVEKQIIQSYGVPDNFMSTAPENPVMPSVVPDSSLSANVYAHKDFSMSRRKLAAVDKQRADAASAMWKAEVEREWELERERADRIWEQQQAPQDITEPLLPLEPDFKDYYCPGPCVGTCKHRRLTVQEAYEFCRKKYETSFPMDHVAFTDMLAYVSVQVPAVSSPRDERTVAQQKKPLYLNPWYWAGASLVLWLVMAVALFH